jgi:hypothetical protein
MSQIRLVRISFDISLQATIDEAHWDWQQGALPHGTVTHIVWGRPGECAVDPDFVDYLNATGGIPFRVI